MHIIDRSLPAQLRSVWTVKEQIEPLLPIQRAPACILAASVADNDFTPIMERCIIFQILGYG